jgi:hypothetical protein
MSITTAFLPKGQGIKQIIPASWTWIGRGRTELSAGVA